MKKLLPKFAYLARIIPKNRIFQQKEVKRNYLFKPPIRGRAFGYEGNYGVKKKKNGDVKLKSEPLFDQIG